MLPSPGPYPVSRWFVVLLILLAWNASAPADDASVIAFPRKQDLDSDSSLACSADGKLLLVITKRNPAIIYGCDTETGTVTYRVEVPDSYHGVTDFAWPPASQTMWLLTNDGFGEWWLLPFDPVRGELGPTRREFSSFGDNKDEGAPIWVRASADGRRYMLGFRPHSAAEDNIVKVYDAKTHAVIARFIPHTPCDAGAGAQGLFDFDLSPDGSRIITTGSVRKAHTTLRLWDASNGQLLGELLQPHDRLMRLKFTPDGRQFATAGLSADPRGSGIRIRLWSVNHESFSNTPALDVLTVVSSTADNTPGYWGSHSRQFALSTDGSMACVACPYFLRVCNLMSGRLALEQGSGDGQNGKPLEDFDNRGVALSPDGKHLWLGNDAAEINHVTLPDVSGKRKLRR